MSGIPFIDLGPGEETADVLAAIDRVVRRGWFVLGPEVEGFEREFAQASGARHAVTVGNGTDAIALLLRALKIGPGDEVIVPAMTAAYTGLAVLMAGARPVFADVDEATLTLHPGACAAAVTARTRAIVPVHLYGQPADLDALSAVAAQHHLAVIEDCCQAHGATARGVAVGTRGAGGAFSFYPTKNLGALGDGGAIITNDAALADRLRRLRNGGQSDRYHHVDAGINSRLDEMQAAILRAKLTRLPGWIARRRALAGLYLQHLDNGVSPVAHREPGHVHHLFAVRSPRRDALQADLRAAGVETLIHYPVPLPAQPAFVQSGITNDACPVAARAAAELLSLPLHPRLTDDEVARVATTVNACAKGRVPA